MVQVKNPGLPNQELNVGGVVIRADDKGVFDVSEEMAARLLTMRGYSKPRETVELRAAYAEYRTVADALAEVQAAFDAAKAKLASAQAQADSGKGTPTDAEAAQKAPKAPQPLVPVEQTPEPAQKAKPSRTPTADTPENDGEDEIDIDPGEEEDGDEDEAGKETALAMRERLGSPSVRWKLADLMDYAKLSGIEVESSATKAEIVEAISLSEDND